MSVIFDSMAMRYVHRLGRLRLEKASWGSLHRPFSGLFLSVILEQFHFKSSCDHRQKICSIFWPFLLYGKK